MESGLPDDVKKLEMMQVTEQFSGAAEEGEQRVESWANDISKYLECQFSQVFRRYPQKEWQVLLLLLELSTRQRVDSTRNVDPTLTWSR